MRKKFSHLIFLLALFVTLLGMAQTVSAAKLSVPVIKTCKNETNGVKLTWSKSSGASGYAIYRKQAGQAYKKIASVKSLSYTDKTAKSAGKYTYKVRAYKGSSVSAFSKTKTILFLANPGMVTVSKGLKGLNVVWGYTGGAKFYRIYRRTANTSWKKIADVKGEDQIIYEDKNVKNNVTYYYTVKAYNGSYYSAYDTKGLKAKRNELSYDVYQLRTLAINYYKAHYNGNCPKYVDVDIEGDTASIHLYEIVDNHTATYEWYYVNVFTGKGTNFIDQPIQF